MTASKIGLSEAILFLLVVNTNKVILNLPKAIILECGNSAWINVIFVSIIAILFTLLLVKLFKKFEGYDIFDISNYLGGGFLKTICGIGYLAIFVFIGSIVLRDFSETLKIIYYSNSPLVFIMLFFMIAAVIGNKFGFKPIVKTNLFIMPIVIFSILVIFISIGDEFVFERLFPIMGNGIDATFISGLSNLASYSGITYLFLIMPFLKDTKQFKKISITALIISSIYLLLSVLCLLLVFPHITLTDETMSIYLLTRSIEYGHFFQRVDAIFVLLFILSCLSYLTITLFLALNTFKKVTNIQNSKAMSYCFAILLLGLALLPKNTSQIRTDTYSFFKYYILIFIFGFSTLIMILANVKKKKEEQKHLQSE